MQIILASSNKGKIKELKELLPQYNVVAYSDILSPFDIIEDGDTFQENAIIKTKAVVKALQDIQYKEPFVVISDDSGITVPALNNEPNIYSARYAGKNATDIDNNKKMILKLQEQNIHSTSAFYTVSLAIWYDKTIYTTHGWMHGNVIDKMIGDKGFGYDPLFIPKGYNHTLGELDQSIKRNLSHRSKALKLAMVMIKSLLK